MMMMSQSKASSDHRSSPLASSATEDELVVSRILLDLRKKISLTESLADFNWGCTRRRSCPDEDPPLPRESERKSTAEKGAATAGSPTTPLSFSPSESDEKRKRSLGKASKKRSREIEVLIQNRDVLRGGIENAQIHYDKLKAYNSELKAIKKEVMNNKFPRKEDGQVELSERTDHRIGNVSPHLRPFIFADPTAAQRVLEYPIGPTRARFCSNGDGAGPLGIDLNEPAVEDSGEPLDATEDKRARFAEARRRRRGLMRAKSMRSSSNQYGTVVTKCQQLDNYENCGL